MSIDKQSTRNAGKKNSKQDKSSSGTMKIFYVFMLALLLFSSIIRITGASRHNKSAPTPAPQVSPASGGTSALAFIFHREDSGSGTCTDLVIPVKGSVSYSDCANGTGRQYNLSDVERSQLSSWRAQFQQVNYDHTGASKSGDLTTRLYLNGLGSQAASDTEVQAMIDFAGKLASKIASQS